MIIQTNLDSTMKDICLAKEAISIYPKHFEWVEKCLNEKRTCFLICHHKKNIACAIIKLSNSYPKKLKLCYLYVKEEFRNRGYGSLLIGAVETYARGKRLNSVYMTASPKAKNISVCLKLNDYLIIGQTQNGDTVFQHEL